MSFDLSTVEECTRINNSLLKAVKGEDVTTLKDILDGLKECNVKGKLNNLSKSKLGNTVHKLGKHQDAEVARVAAALKQAWAALVAAAKEAAGKAPASASVKTADEPAAPMEASQSAVKEEAAAGSAPQPEAAVKAEVKAEAAAAGPSEPAKLERVVSTAAVAYRPARPTGDGTRDMVRTKLQECFVKGATENERFLREAETDTATMAEDAELRMFEALGGVSKEYKARFRSLMFNLKDPKNPHFIRQVITGQIHTNDLADMEVKDMASEEVKKMRQDASEHAKMALMDERTYRNYAGKGQQDGILKCPKCKSMKTEYVEVQTRSADEPTTKKCVCNDCDYRWKFC